MNFKVGDRVEVIGNIDPHYFTSDYIGDTGTVVEIAEQERARYGNGWDVVFDKGGEALTFFEGELKKVDD